METILIMGILLIMFIIIMLIIITIRYMNIIIIM